MTDPHAQEYIELLREQSTLADELAELATRQTELIESGRVESLLELLSARQRVMDRFIGNQDRLGALNESVRDGTLPLAAPARERVRVLIRAIGERLGEILKRDESDRDALETRRDEAGRELCGLGTGRAAHVAYVGAQTPAASNRFADERG